MNDIKQYLEETDTVLLTKEAFECLKERACVLDKIRAEIAKDLSSVEKESRYTQDDIDCGICVGLKRAIDTIDKYKAESEDKE